MTITEEASRRDGYGDPVRATVRLQFRQGFTLDDAAGLVPYFAKLGVSHLYASPLFRSRPGSSHGYDILDYGCIDPELGGEDALRRLADALRLHRMGLILDIVPNHMAVGGEGNVWWEDVLAWGKNSLYASFFDISWKSGSPENHGKIILPFLDRAYGAALCDGLLSLKYDYKTGLFFIYHYQHRFTVCPAHYGPLLKLAEAPQLLCAAFCAVAERASPDSEITSVLQEGSSWSRTAGGEEVLNRLFALHDPATQDGRGRLHNLIRKQHWIATWWRTANDIINWRRFFDNTELGAVAVERESVFDATHAYVTSLYARGLIDGVRVDHIDGLAAPAIYCNRLRERFQKMAPAQPADASDRTPVYVEKILAGPEKLPAEWDVDGTTGYDFMDQVSAVLHDQSGAASLNALWRDCHGDRATMAAIELNARDEILPGLFTAEFTRLVELFVKALAEEEGREDNDGYSGHDDTEAAIADVIKALLRHFNRYRTYYADGMLLDHSADFVALRDAGQKARQDLLPSRHDLLRRVITLLSSRPEDVPSVTIRETQRAFEHLTAPLAAKSLEDTAFYRYVRLISRNEVGSDPDRLTLSVPDFHAACAQRLRDFPDTMLTTATHDHKRGEDARMRIAVISEAADEWRTLMQRWLPASDDRAGPDRVDALMLFQTLLGVWPPDGQFDGLKARVSAWLTKALREGKRHTNWLDPDEVYETACQDYLAVILDPKRSAAFFMEMTAFAEDVAPAAALNSLSQTLLRLTTPGMPDLYQGCELWDFSLVDPDNRRAVDYQRREDLLQEENDFDEAATRWKDGAIKLELIRALLRCRAQYPLLFARGSYEPVETSDEHLIVFRRAYQKTQLLVAAPRHMFRLNPDAVTLAPATLPAPVRLPDVCRGLWRSVIRPGRQMTVSEEPVSLCSPDMVPVECLIAEA